MDKTMVVCSMMGILSTKSILEELNIRDIESKEIIEYGPMMVSKEYRGNKLQYQMLLKEDDYYKKLGYKYALVIVCPQNKYSIDNLLRDTFKYWGFVMLDRGERNVYLKVL